MKLWKKWKARHWDEQRFPSRRIGTAWFPSSVETPPLRAWCRKLAEQIRDNPLKALGMLGAFIVGLIGVIAALVQALR